MQFNKQFLLKNTIAIALLLSAIAMYTSCSNKNENKLVDISNAKLEAVEGIEEMQTPAAALAALTAGNQRFTNGQFRHIHIKRIKADEDLNPTLPPIAIVSCSDLKIPADILFDTDKKDLLILKSNANSITPEILKQLEASASSIRLIVVLGHINCDALLRMSLAKRQLTDTDIIDHLKTVASGLLAGAPFIDSSFLQGKLMIKTAVFDESTLKLAFQNLP